MLQLQWLAFLNKNSSVCMGLYDCFAEVEMTDHRSFVKIAGLQANSVTSGFLSINLFMAVLSSLKTFTS